jgi:hypothetical protein
VLYKEELVVSPFDYSGRRFRWLWPVVFSLKLRGFPYKKDWCPYVLICYCCRCYKTSLDCYETSLPRTADEERASLLRGETVSG